MPKSPESGCLSLRAALIAARENRDGPKVTYESVANAFGVTESTGGRILKDGDYDGYCEQIREALTSPLGDIVASVVTCGTDFTFVRRERGSLDLNGDGKVNLADTMHAVNHADRVMGDNLARLLAKGANGLLSSDERADLQQFTDAARAMLHVADEINNRNTIAGPRMTGS